jgi:hypothetical protein
MEIVRDLRLEMENAKIEKRRRISSSGNENSASLSIIQTLGFLD